jgi:hypothetical protein
MNFFFRHAVAVVICGIWMPCCFADQNSDALKSIADTADRICGVVVASGETRSSKVTGDIKGQLGELVRKLGDLGITGSGQFDNSNYVGVLQDQLSTVLTNQQECKLKVLGSLVDKLVVSAQPKARRICGYRRTFEDVRESGWRGGGYDPNRWCQDYLSILSGQFPDGRFTIISSSERSESKCAPFNCPQYNYACRVRIEADPIFVDMASDCPSK